MRRAIIPAVLVFLLSAALPVDAQSTRSADSADALAAESLLHSALNLYHTPDAPARAGRLIAISQYLARLAPDDLRSARLLADVYQSQGLYDQAAAATKRWLAAHPDDYAAQVRWLRFRISDLDRASQRAQLLRKVVETDSLPAPLRADAATESARIYLGQGAQSYALGALKQALELDPLNHTALISRLELTDKPTPTMQAKTMVALLKGNPRAWWVAKELAGLLGDVGLHEQALTLYRYAWTVWRPGRPVHNAPADFAVGYLSALLDAEQAATGIKLFEPAKERLGESTEFLALLAEAYQQLGRKNKAQKILDQMEKQFESKMTALKVQLDQATDEDRKELSRRQADLAMHLGWFYLLARQRPLKALQYARLASQAGATGDAVELLMEAAKVSANQSEDLQTLRTLSKDHALAALFLAEREYRNGKSAQADTDLLAGLTFKRRDLAYRRLAALAREHNVTIPPAEDAPDVASAVADLDREVFPLGRNPQDILHVVLKAPQMSTRIGEGLWVEATLTNASSQPIAVGSWGLIENRLAVVITAAGMSDKAFTSVPVIIWPSPRYLPPGGTITGRTRIDVGPLAAFLANHPLATLRLTVRGVASPRDQRGQIASELPTVTPQPVELTRVGLTRPSRPGRAGLSDITAQAYRSAVAGIEQTLRDGSLAERMQAVRQVASLLSWDRAVQLAQTTAPAAVRQIIDKPQLLTFMGQALRDPAAQVRAEMVASLVYANLGAEILNQLGLIIEDPSPLVRFRVIELIGASDTKGKDKLIALYAKDSDPLVALMAKAFIHDRQDDQSTPPTTTAPENN